MSVQRPIGEVLSVDTSPGWKEPIIAYLKDGTLTDDRAEAQKLLHFATRYTLLRDVLYSKSYSKLPADSYLRCLGPDEAQRVMQEIYGGDCVNHLGGRFCSLGHQLRVLLAQDVR